MATFVPQSLEVIGALASIKELLPVVLALVEKLLNVTVGNKLPTLVHASFCLICSLSFFIIFILHDRLRIRL